MVATRAATAGQASAHPAKSLKLLNKTLMRQTVRGLEEAGTVFGGILTETQ